MIRKFKSARVFKEHAHQLIVDGNLNKALHLIHDFVELIVTEPLCTSLIFSSRDIDDLCQQVGKSNLSNIRNVISGLDSTKHNSSVYTYIVTKLQKSGGHTRVIENFIKARPDARHIILLTGLEGRSDTDYLLNGLAKKVSIDIEMPPKCNNYQERLTWLQMRLLEIQAQNNYLFNHHQDSVAVAAIQPEMQLNASFYHHGDHHLCLGIHLAHIEHIDPHPMGYHYCRDVLGIENTYIPFTVEDKGVSKHQSNLPGNGLTTCTVGRSNKIEIPYYVSYVEVIPRLLKATGGKHFHIGRLSRWALYKIRVGLKRNGVSNDKFVYIPWVASVWSALSEFNIDLYIASFPYGGGITLIEAMGAGVPVALHKHIYSRVLSGIDLAYPGVFYWEDPDKLIQHCTNVTNEELIEHSYLARIHYEQFHPPEILENTLLNTIYKEAPKNIIKDFNPLSDEWAYWMEGHVSLTSVFKRYLYRLLRRVRSIFF